MRERRFPETQRVTTLGSPHHRVTRSPSHFACSCESSDLDGKSSTIMHDLIVIGGGPAALAATAHAVDKRLNVVMVYQDLGGKVGWRESLVRSSQRGHAAGQGGPHPF